MNEITRKQKGMILFISGLILTAIMIYTFIDISLFLKKAVRGQGTVLSARYLHRTHGGGGWVLRVAYTPVNSFLVEAWLSGDGPSWNKYEIGQTVYFLYDPGNYRKLRSLQADSQYPWVEILVILLFSGLTIYGWILLKSAKANEVLTR